MLKTTSHITLLAAFLFIGLSLANKATANSMIGNEASGVVNGSVYMKGEKGAKATLNIGSILVSSERGAKNIKARAYVDGDIHVQAKKQSVTVNIGSVIID